MNSWHKTRNLKGKLTFVRDRTKYNRLRVRKNPNENGVFDVILDDGKRHITYDFFKDVNDDFIMLRTGYSADLGMTLFDKKNYESTTGTFVTSYPPNHYTTQVGATITGKAKGTEVRFASFKNNVGGIWEFVVDGDTANPVTISTFSPTNVAYQEQIIKSGLSDTEHTIVGTYKGADPNNPPAGTAQGWVYYNTDPVAWKNRWTFLGYKNEVVNQFTNGTMQLGFASNKEFAFHCVKNGYTRWFPEHEGIGTALKIAEPQYILDNQPLNLNNMAQGVFSEGKKFDLIQKLYFKMPEVAENLGELTIIHTIKDDGVVYLTSKFKFLQDFKINSGYVFMLPLVAATVREVMTAIGNSKISADEPNHYFAEEQDRVYSFAGIDSRNPNLITAMSIDYPYQSLRMGKSGRNPLNQFFWYWQRDTYPKLYPQVFRDYNATAGEVFKWYGRYAIGHINDVYNLVK
jgi:hypothetical protein